MKSSVKTKLATIDKKLNEIRVEPGLVFVKKSKPYQRWRLLEPGAVLTYYDNTCMKPIPQKDGADQIVDRCLIDAILRQSIDNHNQKWRLKEAKRPSLLEQRRELISAMERLDSSHSERRRERMLALERLNSASGNPDHPTCAISDDNKIEGFF